MELGWIDEMDGQAAADAVVLLSARLVETEAAQFRLAALWADLHPVEATAGAGGGGGGAGGVGSGGVLPGMERGRRYGGDGTPWAGEFAAAELGVLLGVTVPVASSLIADALDVRHRLPALQAAAFVEGRGRVWQLRKVAARTREVGLSLEQARWVDGEVARYLGILSWSKFLELVEAKIIAADPGAAEPAA